MVPFDPFLPQSLPPHAAVAYEEGGHRCVVPTFRVIEGSPPPPVTECKPLDRLDISPFLLLVRVY